MKIYYDFNHGELLTEEETLERITNIITENELYLDYVKHDLSSVELWDMLSFETQVEIMNKLTESILEADFICREF